MRIRVNFQSLKGIRWHEYLTRFVLGGVVTVATGLIASRFGPVIGGLFLAFPAIFPAGATLIDKHEKEKKRKAGIPHTIRGRLAVALDARGAARGALALAVFAWFLWKVLPLTGAAFALAAGLGLWLTAAIALWLARKFRWQQR
jgi:hypothetical protein